MSIKPDKWIRRMALEHGMIEPFVENQVRMRGDERLISYGVSSYGYDVRCADEFKVFTNIHSATVDPKNFDEKSFVDVKGPVCIIPPNSFALARTVEYFRIPRNVLTICLGKSTYARCFRGDTRVALVDGTAPTLEEMARRAEQGELFWGYSIGENGRLIVTQLQAPRYIGRDNLVEVILDNDRSIFATPDHLFMLRDGRWKAAAELEPNMSLMPLYRQLVRGYESVYQPMTGYFIPKKNLVNEWGGKANLTDKQTINFSGNLTLPPLTTASVQHSSYLNHKVKSVRSVAGEHDVYCLTVPEAGNFALEDGVFVHNCGIIVNVTPLEPEWEGHVTLEFSNTTTLPAKIYAHEGVAQMLFLESTEECEVSYRDRGGKYQGQLGVTLPKA
ncbi:deoxycytidine triphosphate deaminase [Azomonas agilis]|uniref:Deoxycytidine triphosphate deaminase n=1 Tax=Azomonas agilis TaxID=116849 RepID=A0A562J0M4_9GAMM|nr:deoxycytidine triphosphate deaminase [Azomonas agilis]